jgi:hypothetical protein
LNAYDADEDLFESASLFVCPSSKKADQMFTDAEKVENTKNIYAPLISQEHLVAKEKNEEGKETSQSG